jgi:hypothetical protein
MDEVFKDMVQSSLSSYWDTESLIINRPSVPQLAGRARSNTTLGREARVLVLRRR